MASFANPRGMVDILPDDWPYWEFVLNHAVSVANLYGYRRIETPTLADTDLFTRSSGKASDIVDKEMYSFTDRGGDDLSLRPEGTAPVMRAYFEHGMDRFPQPVKLYYLERMYRYDRPQRGRFREHRQFGCEAIGSGDAYVDVEMMHLLATLYRRIGLVDLSLHINSIGDSVCRPTYLVVLVSYLRSHASGLSTLDRERIERNPLRVLDSKHARSQETITGAPALLEYLCDECRAHWDKVIHGLDLLGIRYEIDNRLVRGLDYYTRTVFEFIPPEEGAQSSVGSGGRYDALAEAMGAKLVPGIGFGSGLERLIGRLRDVGVSVPSAEKPVAYIAHAGAATDDAALLLAARLRDASLPAEMAFGERSLKSQMRQANAWKARTAVIIGEDELQSGTVSIRTLAGGEQQRVPTAEAVQVLDAFS